MPTKDDYYAFLHFQTMDSCSFFHCAACALLQTHSKFKIYLSSLYMKLEIILLWSCKRSPWFNFGSSINQIVHQISANYAFHFLRWNFLKKPPWKQRNGLLKWSKNIQTADYNAQYGHSQSEKKLGVGDKYYRSIKVHT